MSDLHYHNHPLKDGRTLSVFFNEDAKLLVADIIDADDKGGIEIVRMTIPPNKKKK